MSLETQVASYGVDIADNVIRSLVKSVGPRKFFTGLHNAFVHGQVFKDAGIDVNDEQLGQLFEHFEGLIAVAKDAEWEE